MAGTVTITYQEHRTMRTVDWAWTSDGSGDANGTATKTVSGLVHRIVTNPDDSAAPTALYDVVINDADGVDIAGGNLANRSATLSESVTLDPPVAVDGALSLVVSAAGASKSGAVRIYIR